MPHQAEDSPLREWFHRGPIWWQRLTIIVAPIALLFLSLGEATDAGFLLRDLWYEVYSSFTNEPDYKALSKLHVGNTSNYAESLFGAPQVTRKLQDGSTAKYIFREKFLLTLLVRDERITAFTVITLDPSFAPELALAEKDVIVVGDFYFDDARSFPDEFRIDHSSMGEFYIESFGTGRPGRFLSMYLGEIAIGRGDASPNLRRLEQSGLVVHNATGVSAELSSWRKSATPNLYGYGELELKVVTESLLSVSEYVAYSE